MRGKCSGKRDEIRPAGDFCVCKPDFGSGFSEKRGGALFSLPSCRAREPEKAGDKYVKRGGFGGSCFPKKVSAGEKIHLFRKEKTLHFQSGRVIIN